MLILEVVRFLVLPSSRWHAKRLAPSIDLFNSFSNSTEAYLCWYWTAKLSFWKQGKLPHKAGTGNDDFFEDNTDD